MGCCFYQTCNLRSHSDPLKDFLDIRQYRTKDRLRKNEQPKFYNLFAPSLFKEKLPGDYQSSDDGVCLKNTGNILFLY